MAGRLGCRGGGPCFEAVLRSSCPLVLPAGPDLERMRRLFRALGDGGGDSDGDEEDVLELGDEDVEERLRRCLL